MRAATRIPAYASLGPREIDARAERLARRLSSCDLCPRRCLADRAAGQLGRCGIAARARVASFGPHFGEERPLVGSHGSGTVFFSGCNLGCVFCQNFDISHRIAGREMPAEALAAIFLGIEEAGCHNLNLVTPTHVAPQVLEALAIAAEEGLRLPLVWNTGGYEAADVLEILDGVVDIYMPDFKMWSGAVACRLLDAPDYPDVARRAIEEMHRQVGDLVCDDLGVAYRGLLVRHLVMPGGIAGTSEIARFLAGLGDRTYLNVMDQYRPCHRAREHGDIDRLPSQNEIEAARAAARAAGLERLD